MDLQPRATEHGARRHHSDAETDTCRLAPLLESVKSGGITGSSAGRGQYQTNSTQSYSDHAPPCRTARTLRDGAWARWGPSWARFQACKTGCRCGGRLHRLRDRDLPSTRKNKRRQLISSYELKERCQVLRFPHE